MGGSARCRGVFYRLVQRLAPAALIGGFALPLPLSAAEFDVTIPMHQKAASTYYVKGAIGGLGAVELLVDTGSSYLAIDETSLQTLADKGLATYVRDLSGQFADGRRRMIPVYRIAEITIGDGCQLRDIDAAVLPGETRYILGLSALNQASPFIFSTAPPVLMLSHCEQSAA